MAKDPHVVALVVDRAFGERAIALCRAMHVWLIDSAVNREVSERVLASLGPSPEYSTESGITLFQAAATEAPEETVARIVETIDEHHGEWGHDPPMSVLEIYGLPLSGELADAVSAIGLDRCVEENGRIVCREG